MVAGALSLPDSFAYAFRKDRAAHMERLRTEAATLALAAAHIGPGGSGSTGSGSGHGAGGVSAAEAQLATQLSTLALAANTTIADFEQVLCAVQCECESAGVCWVYVGV